MPIPTFNADGLLPPGVHDCTLEEIKYRFGTFKQSDQRPRLFNSLVEMIGDVHRSALFASVIVDGSFTTSVAEPNDIDLLLVLHSNHDWQHEPLAEEYNVLSRRRIRGRYKFDAFLAVEDDESFHGLVEFFGRVRDTPGVRKGMLRIKL